MAVSYNRLWKLLVDLGFTIENIVYVGKKFLPVTAAASSNANTNSP